MAEQVFIFGVTAGLFAFLTGIVFVARARRYSKGYAAEAHSGHGE